MPRFFIAAGQVVGARVRITGDDARHLHRSLRVREGERVVVVQDSSVEHWIRVDRVSDAAVEGAITFTRAVTGEPRLVVHVLLALAAQDMDDAIDNLAVAGAASIRPVLCQRSVTRPRPEGAARHLARWRARARHGAQLAGRGRVPDVLEVTPLRAALQLLPDASRMLACVIGPDAVPLQSLPVSAAEHALVIGPEGGLSPDEVDLLRQRGATLVHLGPRTLPHHLAGVLGVSLLLAGAGELEQPVGTSPGAP